MTPKSFRSWDRQVSLLRERQLEISDDAVCRTFLATENYYRFSGYARYFQRGPQYGDDVFVGGTTFEEIRAIYDADEALRAAISAQLARVELLLRSHTAYVIAREHAPYKRYLEDDFYVDAPTAEPTTESCLRDIERSRERHILRFKPAEAAARGGAASYDELPVWSAVEAWSFGTLSKCIERGASGSLASSVAASLGVAQAGFASRVRALVYLRNRCAHHSRLWNHSVIDAGPTPNNVRVKAKRLAGQFGPRSVLDVVASLDDILHRSTGAAPMMPGLVSRYAADTTFWKGLSAPMNSVDHVDSTA